jgi:hypothetical protein
MQALGGTVFAKCAYRCTGTPFRMGPTPNLWYYDSTAGPVDQPLRPFHRRYG